jgi:hypothetical protein
MPEELNPWSDEAFEKVARDDPLVYCCLSSWKVDHCTLEKALKAAVVAMYQRRKALEAMLGIDSATPKPIVVDRSPE